MFDASPSVPTPADGRDARSVDAKRSRLDVAARDIRPAAEETPRGRDTHHDMSSALEQIEARIVFRYLARNPGSRAGEIAAGLGVGQQVVSAHLHRGKGRLFASRAGRWYPVPGADPGGSL